MRKYLLTSPNFAGEMIFGYDADGQLKYYENNAELSTEHIYLLSTHFPFHVDNLSYLVKKGSIKEITDLTFDHFWEAYNNKVGNKAAAEKIWVKLSEADRIAVLDHLPKYRFYLQTHQGLMQAYPTTFLNQRRWENIYK
jgi:hypothetical protein